MTKDFNKIYNLKIKRILRYGLSLLLVMALSGAHWISPSPAVANDKIEASEIELLTKNKNLLKEVSEVYLELSHRKQEMFEASLFRAPHSTKKTEELISQFKEVKSKAEELLKNGNGENELIMALQQQILKALSKAIIQLVSIEVFQRIHKENNFDLWTLRDIQNKWNITTNLNSFYSVFNSQNEVPKEFFIGLNPKNYSSNPSLFISINAQAYYNLALEALMSRVNNRTHLESFRCIMGRQQIELLHKYTKFSGEKFNRIISDAGRFCLNLSPLEMFPNVFEKHIYSNAPIQMDYSIDEAELRSLFTQSFAGPASFFSDEVNQALKEYLIPNPSSPDKAMNIRKNLDLILLFPEIFTQVLSEKEQEKLGVISSGQLNRLTADINDAIDKFHEQVPADLFNLFMTEPLRSKLEGHIKKIEEISGVKDFANYNISKKLHMAEALYFHNRLADLIASHPFNLSFLAYGDLDTFRKEVLLRIINQALFESKSEAFQFVFRTWLGDKLFDDKILPLAQELLELTVDESQKRINKPRDKNSLHQWLALALVQFQKKWTEYEAESFKRYIKDILKPAQILHGLYQQPLDKLNLVYNASSTSFSMKQLLSSYKKHIFTSSRVEDFMKVILAEEDFEKQKSKLKEAMQLLVLRDKQKSKETKTAGSYLSRIFSFGNKEEESLPEFNTQNDRNDYLTLNKIYNWMGYNLPTQPVYFDSLLPVLKKELNDEEIKEVQIIYRKEISYTHLYSSDQRLLDFPLKIDGKKKPLFEWLNPYNDIQSLGEQGIEWLRSVVIAVNKEIINALKEINTKNTDQLKGVIIFSQNYNLALGDNPFFDGKLGEALNSAQTMRDFDSSGVSNLQKLSMLKYHKQLQEQLSFKNKRNEELYDEFHEKYHWQFYPILVLGLTNSISNFYRPAAISSRLLNHFIKSNRSLLTGYWTLFTASAVYDLHHRYNIRQPQIDEERKVFEAATYGGLIPVNFYDSLLDHLDIQQEITDDAIFYDYFYLAMPVIFAGGGMLFQKFAQLGSKSRSHRLSTGGKEYAQRNKKDFQLMANQFEADIVKNIDHFQALGVDPSKIIDLASMQRLWNPSHLQGFLKENSQPSAQLAYKSIIENIYNRLAPLETYPVIFNRYLETYLGKRGSDVFKLIKEEYSKIKGVEL